MAAIPGGPVDPEVIRQDFIYKVTNLIKFSTLPNSHILFGMRVKGTGNSPVWSGKHSMKLSDYTGNSYGWNNTIPEPASGSLGTPSSPLNTATLVSVLRGFMVGYSKCCQVRFTNKVSGNGNLQLSNSDTKLNVRLNNSNVQIRNKVLSEYNIAASALTSVGSAVSADNINTFINKCQTIWTKWCVESPLANITFSYSYCHANHSNHSNHGSRGRR